MEGSSVVTAELVEGLARGLQLRDLPPEAVNGVAEAFAAILEHAARLQGWESAE